MNDINPQHAYAVTAAATAVTWITRAGTALSVAAFLVMLVSGAIAIINFLRNKPHTPTMANEPTKPSEYSMSEFGADKYNLDSNNNSKERTPSGTAPLDKTGVNLN